MAKRSTTAWTGGYLKNRHAAALWVVVALAFLLRVYGIGFGLYHADEPIVVNHALAYGTGDLNPHFFMIPPLVSYLLFVVYAAFFAIGKLMGLFPDINAFEKLFIQNPQIFYILARFMFGAFAGTLGVFVLYRLARKVSSEAVALLAAFFLAVNFLHVRDSHYVYVDIFMTMAVITAMVYCIEIYKRGALKDYLWAGFWVGVATAAKYNAALVGVAMLAAHFLSPRRNFLKIVSAAALSLAVYVLLNPFSILDWNFFVQSIRFQATAESAVGFWHHWQNSLVPSGGIVWALLGVAGFFLSIKKDWKKALVLYVFPVAFFVHLAFFSQPHERYVLPVVFFMCLASAEACEILCERLKEGMLRMFGRLALIFFIVIFPLAKGIQADRLFAAEGTSDRMRQWIETNIPGKSKVAFDHSLERPFLQRHGDQAPLLYAG